MIDPAETARKKRRHRNERIAAAILVLAATIATAAAWRLRQRSDEAALADATYIPKPHVITPEIELLREYLRIDTSRPEGIAAAARWLAEELRRRGVTAELIESTPGYFNVYARVKGRSPGGALLLIHHIDVVPPGDGWKHPPFGGDIVFNELYGRGALDMKSVGICQLLALANIARSGRTPAHDIVFLATAEEEEGSRNGLRWLLEHRPDLFESVEYAVTEGGLAEVISEKMTYFGIEIGGKQLVAVRLEAAAREPLRQARFELQRYSISRKPDRVLSGVREYFRDLAPTRIAFGRYLADIDRTIARGEFWRLPETYREFAQDSLLIRAPAQEGDRWTMEVSMLNLPDTDPDQRIAWLRGVVARHGVRVAQVIDKQGPVPLSPSDTPLFRILAEEARRQYRVESGVQLLFRSMTDCRFLRPRKVACYGISPFPVNFFQSLSIHKRDERIRLDWFSEGISYMDRVVQRWAFPAGR